MKVLCILLYYILNLLLRFLIFIQNFHAMKKFTFVWETVLVDILMIFYHYFSVTFLLRSYYDPLMFQNKVCRFCFLFFLMGIHLTYYRDCVVKKLFFYLSALLIVKDYIITIITCCYCCCGIVYLHPISNYVSLSFLFIFC